MHFEDLLCARIRFNPKNRPDKTKLNLEPLKASIAEVGLLQPLVVRPAGREHELVAGERRLRAVTEMGWKKVSCVILGDDPEQLQGKRNVAENLQRLDLSPLEESAVFVDLLQGPNPCDVEDLAQIAGRSAAYIRGRLALSALGPAGIEALQAGKITLAHALVLCHSNSPDVQEKWLAQMLNIMYSGEIMSAAHARRTFLQGWKHDGYAWPASFVEQCPSCRLPQQASLFEDVEESGARCFDDEHRKRVNELYVEQFRQWAKGKGIEVEVPQWTPWEYRQGRKAVVGLTPKLKRGTKRLVALVEMGGRAGAVTGWVALTEAEIEAAKSRGNGRALGREAPKKPEIQELRQRAAQKAATRHLLGSVRAALETIDSTPALLAAYALVKNCVSMDQTAILRAAGLREAPYYNPDNLWATLRSAGSDAHQRIIRAAIEHALAHGSSIRVQAEAARALSVDAVGTYSATEGDLKSMPREALLSAFSERLRANAPKRKKGELVAGAVGATLGDGLAGWPELREWLESTVSEPAPDEQLDEDLVEEQDEQLDEELEETAPAPARDRRKGKAGVALEAHS